MTGIETQEFILRPTTQHGRALTVSYRQEHGLADLTIHAGGEKLFQGRVLAPFATILHTVSGMEEAATKAKESGEMMKYYGCTYVARHGRTHIASRLNIPEMAEYD